MGDWIKVDHVTPNKPEIVRIATQCRKSKEWALGCMVKLWIWFDAHTTDGVSRGLVLDQLASAICIPKRALLAALDVGWLIQEGEDHFAVPNFRKYISDTKKERDRKRKQRDKIGTKAGTKSGQTRDTSGTSAGQNRDKKWDKSGTIEERREEEKRNNLTVISPAAPEAQTAPPPADAGEAQDDDLIWQAFGPPDTSTDADASSPEPDPSEQSRECSPEPEPEQPPKRARKPRDPERAALWEAIRDVTGLDTSRPRSCKRIQKAIRELREADPPYTAAEVRRLAEVLQELGWTASLTPEAIAKHIDLVRRQPVRVNGKPKDYYAQVYEDLDKQLAEWVRKREGSDDAS